ncbi:MAG: kynureninase, partial [Winogradskyella sp.]|nr:kynureninase [Winogradskyella sp.]
YLNSGPGSLSGVFVHERHAHNKDLNRFTGWWSHNKATRFNMRDEFDLLPGAEGWQMSNPPILSMAAIKASLDVFTEAGMDKLLAKSRQLTAYLEYLINELNNPKIKIITPTDASQRGCQLSIQVKDADKGLHQKLTEAGVISDWREPDVIRCAPVPLYNTYNDAYQLVNRLKSLL